MTPAEVRALDAQYQPIPAFLEWSDSLDEIDAVWSEYLAALQRASASSKQPHVDVGELSLRRAALHTGALEGLHGADRGVTVTIVEHLAWQEPVAREVGSVGVKHIEAAMSAFDLAMDLAARRPDEASSRLTEAALRSLHELACSAQPTYAVLAQVGDEWVQQERPLTLGRYKEQPNHVTIADGTTFAYCPVDDVSREMSRLVSELNSAEFDGAHPVVQAAYSHHAFVRIHPFADGNGRVSRLLASVFLLRAASIPFMVYADQKADYLDALRAADAGDVSRWVDFVLDRSLDAMDWATSEALSRRPIAATEGVVSPTDIDGRRAAADRLMELVQRSVTDIAAGEPGLLDARWQSSSSQVGQRGVADGRMTLATTVGLSVQSSLLQWGTTISFAIEYSVRPVRFPVLVSSTGVGEGISAEFRDSDLRPEITSAARDRLDAFVRAAVAGLLAAFATEAQSRT